MAERRAFCMLGTTLIRTFNLYTIDTHKTCTQSVASEAIKKWCGLTRVRRRNHLACATIRRCGPSCTRMHIQSLWSHRLAAPRALQPYLARIQLTHSRRHSLATPSTQPIRVSERPRGGDHVHITDAPVRCTASNLAHVRSHSCCLARNILLI